MKDSIPKRIVHIWGQGADNLSRLAHASLINVKLLNPDFEFLFFDDAKIDSFIKENFPEYLMPIKLFTHPIQRYDFSRYLIIYKLGGFYFDLDVFLVHNLQDLLNYECVFSFEELTISHFLRKCYGVDWEIGNYAFGATPEHPFILAIIENCVRTLKDPSWVKPMMKNIPIIFQKDFYPFYTSGPGLVTRTLVERKDLSSRVKILFPEDVCDMKNWNLFGNHGIHLHQGTWIKRKGFVHSRLLRLWMALVRRKMLKESAKSGPKRSWE